LDAAGGYGMLTRLMRDLGFDFYLRDKYCANLMDPGFECREALGNCLAVTAMELLERLTDPMEFVICMHASPTIFKHGTTTGEYVSWQAKGLF